jgi:hypothetical protein
MSRLLPLLGALAVLAWTLHAALSPPPAHVLRPRLGIPAVLTGDAPFELAVEGGLPGRAPELAARLERDGRSVPLALSAPTTHLARHAFTATPEEPLEHGAWELVVEGPAGTERLPGAVHRREPLPERFRFVQMADLPTFGGDGSGDALMEQLVREVNLLAPEFVLMSGDVAYVGTQWHFDRLLEHVARFDDPVVVGIGNHEFKGLAGYVRSFRLPFHVVDVDRFRLVSLNSAHGRDQLTSTQMEWLARVLDERGDRTPLIQVHHPLFFDRNVEVGVPGIVELCEQHGVPMVLAGHWHGDALYDGDGVDRRDTWDFPGTKYVVTTTAGTDLRPEWSTAPARFGYRVVEVEGDEMRSFTYDIDGDGTRHFSASHPLVELEIERTAPGAVLVRNRWTEPIAGARVLLRAPTGELQGGVSHGRIVRTSERGGDTEYEVRFDLARGEEATVRLVPHVDGFGGAR